MFKFDKFKKLSLAVGYVFHNLFWKDLSLFIGSLANNFQQALDTLSNTVLTKLKWTKKFWHLKSLILDEIAIAESIIKNENYP